MELLPATTVTDITAQLTGVVSENAGVIVSVLALGIGIRFAMGWFQKATRRVKA